MNFLYNTLILISYFFLKIIAVFNPKIKLFISGRAETFKKLAVLKKEDKTIWFHVASLGEFEQGRPLIERLKKEKPSYKIVLTFFSPSGYEVRKSYQWADVVCYLPFDTLSNMKKFVSKVQPTMVIIVKYEFWFNLLSVLKKENIPTILVSGVFRKNQVFFKSYGIWMRKKLTAFNHFFVQNKESKAILDSFYFNKVTVAGDTRFDRVYEITRQNNQLDFIEDFKNNQYTVVAGSTWYEDEELLVNYINQIALEGEKFIIAPHNITSKNIERLQKRIVKKTVLYSEKEKINLKEYQVFIIDTIGILTKIYAYADVAYVGGGFKTGLHNILEPATFGVPIVFGGNKWYKKFPEAVDLVAKKGCFVVENQSKFSSIFTKLKLDSNFRQQTGKINKQFIEAQRGATPLIMEYIHQKLI